MKLKQKNNKLVLTLVAGTTIIWSFVTYEIIDYFNSFDKSNTEIIAEEGPVNFKQLSKETKTRIDTIIYVDLERDPFVFKKKIRKTNNTFPVKKNKKPLRTKKIKYAINGVIINNKKKLVIFEDLTNNKTFFLREGEEYNEIIIKEIGKTKIVVVDVGKTVEITLK